MLLQSLALSFSLQSYIYHNPFLGSAYLALLIMYEKDETVSINLYAEEKDLILGIILIRGQSK